MDHATFIEIVQHVTGDREQAERAMRATLQTLGERLDREEARQLAAELPPEVGPWLATTGPAEAFDAEEFVRRAAEREGVDPDTAFRHASAVFDAVARSVSRDEWDDAVAELPSDFAPLLPRGTYLAVQDLVTFLAPVSDETGLDADGARRAAEAVLETLAERIAGGEVDDLIARVPLELRAALERGRDATRGRATPMSADRFVSRVAGREGVSALDAAAHTRAVFHALRQAVGDEELRDVTVQLPDEFVRSLVR